MPVCPRSGFPETHRSNAPPGRRFCDRRKSSTATPPRNITGPNESELRTAARPLPESADPSLSRGDHRAPAGPTPEVARRTDTPAADRRTPGHERIPRCGAVTTDVAPDNPAIGRRYAPGAVGLRAEEDVTEPSPTASRLRDSLDLG